MYLVVWESLFFRENTKNTIPNGEEELFVLQTTKWINTMGIKSYILSVDKSYTHNIIKIENNIHIFIPKYDKDIICLWLKLFQPKIIYTIKRIDNIIIDIAIKLCIPILVGYHSIQNIIINRHVNSFVCSEYLQKNIQKKLENTQMICTSSAIDYGRCSYNPKRKFVTQIGLTNEKGGDVFFKLSNKLSDIPFLGIRNKGVPVCNQAGTNTLILEHSSNIIHIYNNTRIYISPTLVDEFSCRVLVECLREGIPVIYSDKGNCKYIMGDAGICIQDELVTNEWISILANLYYNDKLLWIYSKKSRDRYELIKKNSKIQFQMLLKTSLEASKDRNILLFGQFQTTPYLYNFIETLKDDYNVFVYSYIKSESNNIFNIDYEYSLRESIFDRPPTFINDTNVLKEDEIISYIISNNIGKCIFFSPDEKVIEIGNIIKKIGVSIYVIPFIYIDNVYKYKIYNKILNVSAIPYGINNDFHIGYSVNKQKNRNVSLNNYNILYIDNEYDKNINKLDNIVYEFNCIKNKHIDSDLVLTIVTTNKKYKNVLNSIIIVDKFISCKEIEDMFPKYNALICSDVHYNTCAIMTGLNVINSIDDFDKNDIKTHTKGLYNKFKYLLLKYIL